MRLSFFNDMAVLGGGELWVVNACRYLRTRGHYVSVICPHNSALHTSCRQDEIDCYTYLNSGHYGVPFYEPLRHFLQENAIDVLYCTVIGNFCEATVLEKIVAGVNEQRNGSRLALVLKTGLPPMWGLSPEFYGSKAGPLICRLHVVADTIKTQLLKVIPSLNEDFIEVIREGVDLDRFAKNKERLIADGTKSRLPLNKLVITCLGRLSENKGQSYFLAAARQIHDEYPDTCFIIAGDGEDREKLEQKAAALGVEEYVRFTGHVDDVVSLLSATDILCHPSLNDGIPNAIIEAMAMSIPVVASQVGGIPEILHDGVNGMLIPPGQVSPIVHAVKELIADPGKRKKLGADGRTGIERNFNLKKNLEALILRLENDLRDINRTEDAGIQPYLSYDRINVMFLMDCIRTGGEETEVAIVSKYLDKKRFSLSIVSCNWVDEAAPALDKIYRSGISVDTACHRMRDMDDKIRYLLAKIRKEKIKIVVACQNTTLAFNVFRFLAADECRLVEHGGVCEEVTTVPKKYTARYVGVSPKIRDAAAVKMKQACHALYIPSMVDTDEFDAYDRTSLRREYGYSENACIILFVGRLDAKKRVELFLHVARELKDDFPETHFVITGGHDAFQRDYAVSITRAAGDLTAENRLAFTGARNDVAKIMKAADILVLPSVGEGMSHVISEAGAAGLAVVATDDGAASLQIDNGINGRIVDPHETGDLVHAVRELVENREMRRSFGNRLREKVYTHFSAKTVMEQWQQLFEELSKEVRLFTPLRIITDNGTLPFPREIQIQTTTYCNAACVMCPYPEFSKETTHGKMDETLYREILAQCSKEEGFRRVEPFLMNEPFMDPRIIDWIHLARKIVPHAEITLTTNGSLLTPKVADRLVQSPLNAVWFSLNGFAPETFNRISGLSYDTVKRNIDYLLSVRPKRMNILVNMIETNIMQPEIAKNIRYWESRGVEAGSSPLVNRAGNIRNFEDLNYKPLSKRPTRPCELIFYKMYILHNGDVVPCCMDWRRTMVIGNVYRETLADIWRGEPLEQLRALHIERRISELELCSGCSYVR